MAKNKLTLAFDASAASQSGDKRQGPRRKPSKRDAILDAAAGLFNQRGINAVSLADVAQKLGIGRATLYHYVGDREDLVFQCFQRSCEADTERLDIAAGEPDGLRQVLRYLSESVRSEGPETAIVTDTGVLAPEARSLIAKMRKRNSSRLAAMIGAGIEQGVIRPCDEEIIARVLPAMISFTRMAGRWVAPENDLTDLGPIVDFIELGSASDPTCEFSCSLDVNTFSRLRTASFDRQALNEMRIEQILMVGSGLINKHGIDGVSLDDVVASLGATRGAFYHYLEDKEDLLKRCLARGSDLYEAFAVAAEQHGRNGLEKGAIVSHLNAQAMAGPLQPVAAWMGLDALSPGQNQKHRQRMRNVLSKTAGFAAEGVADGSRRDHEIPVSTIARAGAYLWLPQWMSEIENPTPQRIADEVTNLFIRGLRRR